VIVRAIGTLLIALAASGCAPDLQALASDPTALCVKATSIWFTIDVNRNHGCELAK
jgi:hypothetical protein